MLVLTTPNGEAIRRDAPDAMLLSVLSPGHHLALFRAATLGRLLAESGFCDVASASRPEPVRGGGTPPLGPASARGCRPGLYRRTSPTATRPTRRRRRWSGLAYRLFKERVNAGEAGEALPVFDRLRRGLPPRIRPRPRRARDSGRTDPCPELRGPGPRLPLQRDRHPLLPGVVALTHDRADAEALEYFRAAAAAGAAVRTALRSIGADDGETEELARLARVHAAYCMARVDPEAALAELAAVEPGPDGARGAGASRGPPNWPPRPASSSSFAWSTPATIPGRPGSPARSRRPPGSTRPGRRERLPARRQPRRPPS